MVNHEKSDYLSELRNKMDACFNLDEFKELCFDLNVDYEHLAGESANKRIKIQSLIYYLGRHERLHVLIQLLKVTRPTVQFPDIPKDKAQIQFDIESVEPIAQKPDGRLVAALTTLLLFVLCGYLGALSYLDKGIGAVYFLCVPIFLFVAIYGYIMAAQYKSKRAKVISIALGISSTAHIILLLVALVIMAIAFVIFGKDAVMQYLTQLEHFYN